MPKKSKAFLKRSTAAKKAAQTRARNKAFRELQEEKEKRAIELMLGEEFESLREARDALTSQAQPTTPKEKTRSISDRAVIDRIIAQLDESTPGGIRQHISSSSFDSDSMTVKISIRGKSYTRHLTAHLTDRRSPIVKWTTRTEGKRHHGKRRKR